MSTHNQLERLLAERANAWEEYQSTLSRASEDGFDAETRQKLDRLDSTIDEQTRDIERLERAEERERRFEEIKRDDPPEPPVSGGDDRRTGDEGDAYRAAFDAWLRQGNMGITAEHRDTLQRGWVSGDELRAQGVGTDAAGGYTVPEGFLQKITESMKAFGGMLQVANVLPTSSGQDLPWPTVDDTGNVGALLSENTQVTEQDVTFGQRKLGAFTYSSKLVRVSIQLLNDSAFDLEARLALWLGQRIGRIVNQHLTTGTGGGTQPQGVVTGATVGITGVASTGPDYDDIVDLEHSVDPAYRNERARFMFNDSTLAYLRKLKDADNRPIWQPTPIAGMPSTINGRPYTINQDVADIGSSAKSMAFGDFEAGYVARLVGSVQLLQLRERYADFLQVGFLGFRRVDGLVDDTGAVKVLEHAV